MIQNLVLVTLVFLCILFVISLIRKPFVDRVKNPCRFKILPPKYKINGNKKYACFSIIVEKRHRYFINFPLLFKFYSDSKFRTMVKVFYSIPGEDRQMILDKEIEFISKTKEHIVYISDVIMGKILIDIELEIDSGSPIIGFEIMQNNTCTLMREHKLELKFPQ